MLSLLYPGDDGANYQIGSANDVLQNALGDLGANVDTDQVFPFHWLPRGFYVKQVPPESGEYSPLLYPIACTTSNTTWLAGPGTVVTVSTVDYIVTSCFGESRAG